MLEMRKITSHVNRNDYLKSVGYDYYLTPLFFPFMPT